MMVNGYGLPIRTGDLGRGQGCGSTCLLLLHHLHLLYAMDAHRPTLRVQLGSSQHFLALVNLGS